jgi:hypothetical protein
MPLPGPGEAGAGRGERSGGRGVPAALERAGRCGKRTQYQYTVYSFHYQSGSYSASAGSTTLAVYQNISTRVRDFPPARVDTFELKLADVHITAANTDDLLL